MTQLNELKLKMFKTRSACHDDICRIVELALHLLQRDRIVCLQILVLCILMSLTSLIHRWPGKKISSYAWPGHQPLLSIRRSRVGVPSYEVRGVVSQFCASVCHSK